MVVSDCNSRAQETEAGRVLKTDLEEEEEEEEEKSIHCLGLNSP